MIPRRALTRRRRPGGPAARRGPRGTRRAAAPRTTGSWWCRPAGRRRSRRRPAGRPGQQPLVARPSSRRRATISSSLASWTSPTAAWMSVMRWLNPVSRYCSITGPLAVALGGADAHAVLAQPAAAAAARASSVTSMPPSPVVMTLRGWNENAASSARAPTGSPGPGGADGARRVLHDGDAERVAQRPHGVDVGGHAGLVDQDHGPGARGEPRLHGGRGEVLGDGVDVGEHRRRPHVADGVGGGDERQRRHDDLVARAHARQHQGQVQAGGARRHGHGVGGADPPRRRRPRTRPPGGPGPPSPTARRRRPPRPPPRRARAA